MPESLLLPTYNAMAEAEPDLSTFENKTGLAEDMKFLASMPELCDVTFLVGDTREPVCAVKAVLAARSRVFHKMLYQVWKNKSIVGGEVKLTRVPLSGPQPATQEGSGAARE